MLGSCVHITLLLRLLFSPHDTSSTLPVRPFLIPLSPLGNRDAGLFFAEDDGGADTDSRPATAAGDGGGMEDEESIIELKIYMTLIYSATFRTVTVT